MSKIMSIVWFMFCYLIWGAALFGFIHLWNNSDVYRVESADEEGRLCVKYFNYTESEKRCRLGLKVFCLILIFTIPFVYGFVGV